MITTTRNTPLVFPMYVKCSHMQYCEKVVTEFKKTISCEIAIMSLTVFHRCVSIAPHCMVSLPTVLQDGGS